jgi:sugar O-acyltransferase (sialic acid O-acetyltransferase NeuD family)
MIPQANPAPPLKLIIIGDSAFAEVAYEYFTIDSPYEVVAFSVESAYLKRTELFGLPIVAFESLPTHFPANEYAFYVATVYTQLNRLRTRLCKQMKMWSYTPASYISSKASVWRNVTVGEHCFIFENNVIQPFSSIGNNVVLWSGNHIGHHSTIGDNTFIASHAVISGFVDIGRNCFVGVNATFGNNLQIGDDCVIGAGALVTKNVPADHVIRGGSSELVAGAKRLQRVRE